MTDKDLIQGIKELQDDMHKKGFSAFPLMIIEQEVNKRITLAGHYKALYESMCARYGAEEELPPLED